MSNDSQESPVSSRHRFYPSVLTQMQIERLKREDDEEHWISGEELYTEGSSDDEEDQRSMIRDPGLIKTFESIRSDSPSICSRLKSSRKNPAVLGPRSIAHDRNIAADHAEEKLKIDDGNSSAVMAAPIVASIEDEEINFSISGLSCKENCAAVMKTDEHAEKRGGKSNAVKTADAGDVDEEEEGEEISWRPKRDSIKELRELQFEYNEILDSLSDLKTSLLINEPSNCPERSDNSGLLNANYGDDNHYEDDNDNENIDDSRISSAPDESVTILMQQLRNNCKKKSPTAAADRSTVVNEEIIIIEDVDDSFSDNDCLQDVKSWSNAIINTAKIKKEMFKMLKLDMCIEELDQKVKKAREETLREQISNRRELKRLQSLRSATASPESGSLARNFEEFCKLCTMQIEPAEGEDISSDFNVLPIILPSQNELEKSSDDDEDLPKPEDEEPDEEESRQSRREKLEKELKLIDKRKASFIERNKELASLYALHGNLAITDEEKNRLEKLLEDIRDEESENDKNYSSSDISWSTATSTPYKFDKEADELLKNLTEQLENMNSETYRKAGEERSKNFTREEFLPHKEQVVLNSLRNLSESNSEIIYPISEEGIRVLINEYYAEQEASSSRISANDFCKKLPDDNSDKDNLDVKIPEDSKSNSNSVIGETPTISREIINELIDEAKTAMPLFQFKYHHENKSIEETDGDNNDENSINERIFDSLRAENFN